MRAGECSPSLIIIQVTEDARSHTFLPTTSLPTSPLTMSAARVQIYGSEGSGNKKAEGYQTRIKDVLNIKGIPFDFLNVAYDEEAKAYMKQKNLGKTTELPQIFVNGEFRGVHADFDDAVETETLDQFLGL